MQTLIYMIRHGESVGNQKRDFLGHTDLPITEKGEKQALAAADYLASIGFAPDAVYASPLCRAHKTALLALSKCSAPDPILLDGLREIYAGDWEGKNFDALDVEYPEERRVWREDIGHARPVGGEAVAELYGRVVSTVLTIAKENEGKTEVVAVHATLIRAVQCLFEGKTLDQMNEVPWVPNASITTLGYENGRMYVISGGRSDHLGDLERDAIPKDELLEMKK